jgi:lipopolysaccharide heptosyltransferase II
MNNILVVNVNWLGDAVFSTPVFKILKENYPNARISCLCVPRVKSVLEFCPFIDEIIVIDEKEKHFWPWDKWKLIKDLRRRAFDTAFLLHRSSTRGLLVYLAGIPKRIGYCKTKNFLTHPIVYNDQDIHRSDVYLNVLRGYGLKINNSSCELNLKASDVQRLNEFLETKGVGAQEKLVVFHTAGNWELKRWPPSYFASLIETLTQDSNVKVVLSGGQAEIEYCQRLNQQANDKAVVVAGETSLGESLALYKRALVVVSSDSGPLHLAHSVGANVVGIYGPTRIETTGPRGKGQATILFKDVGCNKAPCYHLSCGSNVCMQSITVSDVSEAIQQFIS